MGREEQIEEREVLGSIFPDEITDLSDTSYKVSIALDVDLYLDDDTKPTPSCVVLTVTYPPEYPDERPILGLTLSQDAPKPDHLALPEDAPELLSALEEPIKESLGAAMIFNLISALKDSAESLIASRVAAIQKEADKEAAQAEERENVKFHGEAVTRESFLAWRQKFLEEQNAKEAEEKRLEEETGTKGRKSNKEEHRLTGRELWERGLVGKIEEDDDEEEDAIKQAARLHLSDNPEERSETTVQSSTNRTTDSETNRGVPRASSRE